jgi:transcriptional regulator with XRE-family HTH domain
MIAAYHLKEMRLERNYTQEHLADELDVSQKTYSNKENGKGKITMRDLLNLSRIYECEVLELVAKLIKSSPEIVQEIENENQSLSDYEVHHGVNDDLSLELLRVYKARVIDLEKMVVMKDEKITRLKKQLDKK